MNEDYYMKKGAVWKCDSCGEPLYRLSRDVRRFDTVTVNCVEKADGSYLSIGEIPRCHKCGASQPSLKMVQKEYWEEP